MLLVLLVIVNLCCGIELYGSENAYHKDNHPCVQKHKPLPHILLPHRYKIVGHVNINVQPTTQIVTVTKTIVTETTKRLQKQPMCVKAHQRVSYCHSSTQVQATPVLQPPIQETTKVIGTIEKIREGCDRAHQGREGRHDIPPNHFKPEFIIKKYQTVTETLGITRVEQYADSIVTATLIAQNCIPVNEDMPPCPVEVEDYDTYKPGTENFSIFGKEEPERRIDEDMNVSDERTYFNSSLLFQL